MTVGHTIIPGKERNVMAYVFQYGSNTLPSRFNSADRLRGDAQSLGAAYTEEEFELDFDVWSRGNECAAADIISGRGRRIWGVLYEIPDHLINRETSGNRKSLDAIEGRKYERRTIAVMYPDGAPVDEEVITYVVLENEKRNDIQTSAKYCGYIIAGLREHNVPDEYIEYAKARMITNNPGLRADVEVL
jgi:AIG2 family protein